MQSPPRRACLSQTEGSGHTCICCFVLFLFLLKTPSSTSQCHSVFSAVWPSGCKVPLGCSAYLPLWWGNRVSLSSLPPARLPGASPPLGTSQGQRPGCMEAVARQPSDLHQFTLPWASSQTCQHRRASAWQVVSALALVQTAWRQQCGAPAARSRAPDLTQPESPAPACPWPWGSRPDGLAAGLSSGVSGACQQCRGANFGTSPGGACFSTKQERIDEGSSLDGLESGRNHGRTGPERSAQSL